MAKFPASRLAADPVFEGRLASLRAQPVRTPAPAELEHIVTSVVKSLSGGVTLADLQLYHEVEALGEYIQSARQEIASLRPHDIREQHIPVATDELDAVVHATADATGVILGGMEEIERFAATLPPDQARPLGDVVVKVYEACSFQDITGQRISKVVRTLKHIEGKIDALIAIFGADLAALPAEAPPPEESINLLNGPALPSAGNSQADIDAILAGFD